MEDIPDVIKYLVRFLKAIELYREGDFDAAEAILNEIISQGNAYSSQSYYLKGLINLLRLQLPQALSDFDAVTVEGVKDSAEGMALRTLFLIKDTDGINERIKTFQKSEPLFYWLWKSRLDAFDNNWHSVQSDAIALLESIDKTWSDSNYWSGYAHSLIAYTYFQLNETPLFEKSLEKLIFSFENELYKPYKFHLAVLIQALQPSYFNDKQYSFDDMLAKAHLSRLDHAGLRAFLNCLVDSEIFIQNQFYQGNFLNLKEILLRSLTHVQIGAANSKNKILNTKTKSNSFIEFDLLFEEVIVLVQGSNLIGIAVYSYVKLDLKGFRKMRDAMLNREDASPSDYGEVLMEDYGFPDYELLFEMQEKFKMVSVPKQPQLPVTIWD